MIDIRVDGIKEAQRALADIPKGVEKAASRAINYGLSRVRTKISTTVRKEYNVSAATVKQTLKIRKATYRNLRGEAKSEGRPIRLTNFGASKGKGMKLKWKGGRTVFAAVQVKKRGGYKRLLHSFFMSVGHPALYHRERKERNPIEREYGPSVPQMIGNPAVLKQIEAEGRRAYQQRLEQQVNYLLGGDR